jgi:diguanylate cyclase (GGDEF)-like protein
VLQGVLTARLAFTEEESLIAVKENNRALQLLKEKNDLDVYLSNTLKLEIARLFMDLRRTDDARPLLAELREQAHRLTLDSLAQRVSRVSLGISSLSETILPEVRQPIPVLMDIARKDTQLAEMHQSLTEIQQVNLLVEMSNEEPDLNIFLQQVIGVLDRRVPADDFAIFLLNDDSGLETPDVVINNEVASEKIEFWRNHLLKPIQKVTRLEGEDTVCIAWPLKMASVKQGWMAISGDMQQQSVWNEPFLAMIAQQLGLILDRRLREAYLERQNRTDLLTGILNRAGLSERLTKQFAQMKRKPNQAFALCYFDLDHFKYFNDQFGHELGDQVLKNLSQMVLEHLRGSDELGRVGGDEFIILLRETGELEARQLMERLRKLIAAPDWWLPLLTKADSVDQNPVPKDEWISASFGVVVVDRWPEADINQIELIAQGDAAMYEAKSQGKNCVVIRQFKPNR